MQPKRNCRIIPTHHLVRFKGTCPEITFLMCIYAVRCRGVVVSLFGALIDSPAPNLIFIRIFIYLQEAS